MKSIKNEKESVGHHTHVVESERSLVLRLQQSPTRVMGPQEEPPYREAKVDQHAQSRSGSGSLAPPRPAEESEEHHASEDSVEAQILEERRSFAGCLHLNGMVCNHCKDADANKGCLP
jgi:hypothetical protein